MDKIRCNCFSDLFDKFALPTDASSSELGLKFKVC